VVLYRAAYSIDERRVSSLCTLPGGKYLNQLTLHIGSFGRSIGREDDARAFDCGLQQRF